MDTKGESGYTSPATVAVSPPATLALTPTIQHTSNTNEMPSPSHESSAVFCAANNSGAISTTSTSTSTTIAISNSSVSACAGASTSTSTSTSTSNSNSTSAIASTSTSASASSSISTSTNTNANASLCMSVGSKVAIGVASHSKPLILATGDCVGNVTNSPITEVLMKQDDTGSTLPLTLAGELAQLQRSLSVSTSSSSNISPTAKIFGRNANGTLIATSRPSNEAEIELYRVLQRASLLRYYDTLLEMGGDDVQQLYEAGEEEFLEIMALVGMASKPLHVRRLQKALNEWATNPALFRTLADSGFYKSPTKLIVTSNPASSPSMASRSKLTPPLVMSVGSMPPTNSSPNPLVPIAPLLSVPAAHIHPQSQLQPQPQSQPPSQIQIQTQAQAQPQPQPPIHATSQPSSQSLALNLGQTLSQGSQAQMPLVMATNVVSPSFDAGVPTPTPPIASTFHQVSSSCPLLTPALTDIHISRITLGAEKIAQLLPPREPRVQSAKKRTSRELEQVMAMSDTDPRRMDEIRKYSAIYGRFDCKRRPEKPLTLHEVCVNEAAAQLCNLVPALLTRRDELFPLARQIVKDAGLGHSASAARYCGSGGNGGSGSGSASASGSGSMAGVGVTGAAGAELMSEKSKLIGAGMIECHPSESSSSSSTSSMALVRKRQRYSSQDMDAPNVCLGNRESPECAPYNLFALYQKFFRTVEIPKLAKCPLDKSEHEENLWRHPINMPSAHLLIPTPYLANDQEPELLPAIHEINEMPATPNGSTINFKFITSDEDSKS